MRRSRREDGRIHVQARWLKEGGTDELGNHIHMLVGGNPQMGNRTGVYAIAEGAGAWAWWVWVAGDG